jgi:hypothetical protein
LTRHSGVSALVVVVVAATVWFSLSVATGSGLGATNLANCPSGIPIQKCNPSTDLSTTSTAVPTQPIPVPIAFFPSPTQVPCGASFFNAADSTSLQKEFGQSECFMFAGGDDWIIIGTGLATGSTSPVGGVMIAVERCTAGNNQCLDPNVEHDFSSFTVNYPPDAATSRLGVEQTFGGRLLDISDAYCGQFAFDISTGNWYPFSVSNVSSLMNGTTKLVPLSVPSAVTGTTALESSAPPLAISNSCN